MNRLTHLEPRGPRVAYHLMSVNEITDLVQWNRAEAVTEYVNERQASLEKIVAVAFCVGVLVGGVAMVGILKMAS